MSDDALYHGSPGPITEIRAEGLFGGLFAAGDRNTAAGHGDIVHTIVSPRPLTDYELNYDVDGAWDAALALTDGDEALAEAIMDVDCPVPDGLDLRSIGALDEGEAGWIIQRMRGELAAQLGYTSVEMRDEHGTTWLCLPGCAVGAA